MEGFDRNRAGSRASRLGPALINRRKPLRSWLAPCRARDSAASSNWAGSRMRPAPRRSQANKPVLAGSKANRPGSAWSRRQLRCTAGPCHMLVFMAAASKRGASVASRVDASKLSARPCTKRAKLLALRGTTSTNSAHSASSICNGLGWLANH